MFVNYKDVQNIEKKIINHFSKKYKISRGNEWFEGDVKMMTKDMYNIIENFNDEQYMSEPEHDFHTESEVEEVVQKVSKRHTSSEQIKCPTCYKIFKHKRYLKDHTPMCKKRASPLQCEYCHRILNSSASLCMHRKKCKNTHKNNNEQKLHSEAAEEHRIYNFIISTSSKPIAIENNVIYMQ